MAKWWLILHISLVREVVRMRRSRSEESKISPPDSVISAYWGRMAWIENGSRTWESVKQQHIRGFCVGMTIVKSEKYDPMTAIKLGVWKRGKPCIKKQVEICLGQRVTDFKNDVVRKGRFRIIWIWVPHRWSFAKVLDRLYYIQPELSDGKMLSKEQIVVFGGMWICEQWQNWYEWVQSKSEVPVQR